ncbi:hypothetical protein N431DRAFT_330660 [Stipitochalara longipes BDJ]|nr:hypothetical protein N431DRAFT_330660 [Stipitochalara longipes BDJ]
MASSKQLSHVPKDEEVQEIDSWKSWKEVGESQLQASTKEGHFRCHRTTTPLRLFDYQDLRIKPPPAYNHRDWKVTARRLCYTSNGSCKGADHWDEHSVEIPWPTIEKKQCSNFQSFPLLPPEIRRKIWKYALPESKILQFVYHGLWDTPTYFSVRQHNSQSSDNLIFRKTAKALTTVCQESRSVFFENYRQIRLRGGSIASLWDEHAEPELSDIGNTAKVSYYSEYFDSKKDTLLFELQDLHELYQWSAWLDLSMIQNIAIYYDPNTTATLQNVEEFLNDWPRLRRLYFVLGTKSVYSKHTALTEVLRLVEIQDQDDLDLTFTASFEGEHSSFRFSHQRSVLQLHTLKTQSDALKAQFGNMSFALSHRKIDLRICLMGMIHGDGFTAPIRQPIYLLPTNPEFWGVCFYTFLPVPEILPPHRVCHMRIEELKCDVACLEDGTLLPLHDGDAMKSLFGEDE